ncbi:DUF6328 family protein [Aestuariimicrobium sp. T2.26MG-19.2B]|uniref:DUF6328 family protein n=1 Tax=Aestuariimicrobium sp. T2.26MG-19.2B TaxID=3040679 RepID=UPI0024775C39|nr:DUF6328 family protein [Aestuariimicrobium sp. T2.26MG-19.2B]CAI9401037.1 hypothetical protein AESSP_00512 [Aestuariimicrobium sp. T2.26MG-19.2B]
MSKEPDADPGDGRDETVNERMDRNWTDILQEVRATQTGTQVLAGFLLSVAFQPKFGALDQFQRATYLMLVLTAVITTVLALAPVSLHRSLFRKQVKPRLVRLGHLCLRASLVGVAMILCATVLLVVDVAAGRGWALGATSLVVLLVVGVALLPRVVTLVPHDRGR